MLKYVSFSEQHPGTSTLVVIIDAHSYYTATNYTALHVVAADRSLHAANTGL